MKLFSLMGVFVAIALYATADAVAEPRLVAEVESVGTPVFAGDDVVYLTHGSGQSLELRRTTASGETSVLRTFPHAPELENPMDDGWGEYRTVDAEAAGSPTHVAASTWEYTADRYGPGPQSRAAAVGPLSALADLPVACPRDAEGMRVDIDGSRLALVGDDCRVRVRDLATGEETVAGQYSRGAIRFAGAYVAYATATYGLEVFDLATRTVAYRARTDAGVASFALQGDGKVAVELQRDFDCRRVDWFSREQPRAHRIARCEGGPVSGFERDRVVYERDGRLGVSSLAGRFRALALPQRQRLLRRVGVDGGRVVYATRGCSPDTGAIYSVGVDDGPTQRVASVACRARIGRGPLKPSRSFVVRVKVACATGCRGAVRVDRRGRRGGYEEVSWPTAFTIRAGGAKTVPVELINYLAGRRSFSGRVVVKLLASGSSTRQPTFTRAMTVGR